MARGFYPQGNKGLFKKGGTPWNKGVHGYTTQPCTEERKKKIGIANSLALKGKKASLETRLKKSIVQRGANNHQWLGGITKKHATIRRGLEMRLWREAVFARDDYTCQLCQKRGVQLNADHIEPFAYYPALRFDVSNGRTLCVPCHKATDTYLSGAHKHKQLLNKQPAY